MYLYIYVYNYVEEALHVSCTPTMQNDKFFNLIQAQSMEMECTLRLMLRCQPNMLLLI